MAFLSGSYKYMSSEINDRGEMLAPVVIGGETIMMPVSKSYVKALLTMRKGVPTFGIEKTFSHTETDTKGKEHDVYTYELQELADKPVSLAITE